MKATIGVADRKEADLIRRGLDDGGVRALVIVMGALATLPTDAERQRAVQYACDLLGINLGGRNGA